MQCSLMGLKAAGASVSSSCHMCMSSPAVSLLPCPALLGPQSGPCCHLGSAGKPMGTSQRCQASFASLTACILRCLHCQ